MNQYSKGPQAWKSQTELLTLQDKRTKDYAFQILSDGPFHPPPIYSIVLSLWKCFRESFYSLLYTDKKDVISMTR